MAEPKQSRWFNRIVVERGGALYQPGIWPLWVFGASVCFNLFFRAYHYDFQLSLHWFLVDAISTVVGGVLGMLLVYALFPFSPLGWLVRADADTLAFRPSWLSLPSGFGGRQIKVALPALRALTIETTRFIGYSRRMNIRIEQTDGTVKTVRPIYPRAVIAAIVDFLQRKLPPSVALKVNQSALR